MLPLQKKLNSAVSAACGNEAMSQGDMRRLADIVGWKHGRAIQDMCELLYSVQLTAAIFTRPTDKAIHRDLLAVRRAFQRALDLSGCLENESIRWLAVAGYQARHIEAQDEANAAANLLRSDLQGLRRLAAAIDFAIEVRRPKRGRPQIDQMVQVLVDDLIWSYRRFISNRFRGVRATKTRSPGPDFVREVMRLLVPSATKAQVDGAMRRSKVGQSTVIPGAPDSASKRKPTKGPVRRSTSAT
jgi:hypothetical protein